MMLSHKESRFTQSECMLVHYSHTESRKPRLESKAFEILAQKQVGGMFVMEASNK